MKFIHTARMLAILDEAELLDQRLDIYRGPWRKALNPEMRELAVQIEKLMAEYWSISLEVNKGWHAQPPLWKKKFS
ncbi:MAG: hypothetical protein M0R74_11680 [Dehalococcoidia bacterium]|nr:hypothetical protein [Dehalococcoidia bacterium]